MLLMLQTMYIIKPTKVTFPIELQNAVMYIDIEMCGRRKWHYLEIKKVKMFDSNNLASTNSQS